jgi:DNA-directed RNA polymerase specialized sigma24 family protein
MTNIEALSQELTRKFGEDAAQHAIMRVVEKGWHLDAGTNEVERFAKVCAYHFKLSELEQKKREPAVEPGPSQLRADADALRQAQAREELERLPEIVVEQAFWGNAETARRRGVAVGTVKSRISRVMGRSK